MKKPLALSHQGLFYRSLIVLNEVKLDRQVREIYFVIVF